MILRGGAAAARRAHNPKVGGSIQPRATGPATAPLKRLDAGSLFRRWFNFDFGPVERPRVRHGRGYLTDETGNVRFWPVRCNERIDAEALARDRDQLWAEAVALYQAGALWWPQSRDQVALCTAEQEARFAEDERTSIVANWLESEEATLLLARDEMTTVNLLQKALRYDTAKMDRAAQTMMGIIMHRLGWTKARQGRRGRDWVYRRPEGGTP